MAFYDFPAKHWRSTGTTNPIESAFGTIRCRTGKNKGCLSSQGMLHMIFKLGMRAENNWRKLNGSDFTSIPFLNFIHGRRRPASCLRWNPITVRVNPVCAPCGSTWA